ncbi:penicillin-binding transpeptidase domain-containing protein [Oligoflexaceae bacterium]|nr:penicillin-binding transpeptidase domain-containing protein [Oligoflexaceae bacterium]
MKIKSAICPVALIFITCFISTEGQSENPPIEFLKKNFQDKDACFYMVDLDTGKTIYQLGRKRCIQKFEPCSTFKLSLAAMAFDSGYFKSFDQTIKWDGKKYSRQSLNQNQTPKRFLKYSVNWVGDLIVSHLGVARLKGYLKKFAFGDVAIKDGDSSSHISHHLLKLSAHEQVSFIQTLWKGRLVSDKAFAKVKEVSEIKTARNFKLYGKTGTGCIDPQCMSKPGRQLGWFIGVLVYKSKRYAFAANSSDLKPSTGYGGPKTMGVINLFFEKFYP